MLQDDQDRYVRLETYIKKLESEKEEYDTNLEKKNSFVGRATNQYERVLWQYFKNLKWYINT